MVQSVILFGAETWVLTAAMLKKLEGLHVVFLWQVEVTTARNLGFDTWQKDGAERVIQAIGKNPLR